MLSNAESRNVLDGAGRNCWKGQKCQRESVRNAILHRRTEQQELGDGVLIALESIQRERIPLRRVWPMYCVSSLGANDVAEANGPSSPSPRHQVVRSKGMSYGI